MALESVDHILVKYIKLVEHTIHNDDGIYKLALHIKSLEARIAELEAHRSCNGCKWHGCNYTIYQDTCKQCGRINNMTDYYEPKETK